MKQGVALAALLALFACSSSAQQQGGAGEAARVGDRVITLEDVERRWKASNPADHAQAVQKLYDGRRAALEAIIGEMLLAEAASKAGLSAAAYEEAEISKRVREVTDAEVESFYRANIAQMQGQPLAEMAPLINRFLQEQYRGEARQQVIAGLRKSAPPIRVSLEAPRHEVAVESTDPFTGSASAPVTIVEFSDFQCPYCRQASPTLKRLQETYGDRLRIVWKDFPLTQIHPDAFKAAEAAHCAAEQGQFWPYHDRLFANQDALQPGPLKAYAAELQLDTEQFNSCLDSSKFAERVRDGVALGTSLGVNSTPTIYVNGRAFAGAYPYETLVAAIEEELQR